jgi:hypothetical protein
LWLKNWREGKLVASLLGETAYKVAEEVMGFREQAVKEAVDYAMGRSDWSHKEVAHRGRFLKYPDGSMEFVFDGRVLLEFTVSLESKKIKYNCKKLYEN